MAFEVSVRALDLPFKYLSKRKISLDPILEGLPFPPKYFSSPKNKIHWEVFALVAKRIATALGGAEKLAEMGAVLSSSYRAIGFIVRQLGRQQSFYRWIDRSGSGLLFSNFTSSCVERPDGSIRFELTLLPEYEVSEEFFLINKGVFAAAPVVMGYPPANITMERKGHSTVYEISLAPNRRLKDIFVNFVRSFRFSRAAAAAELEQSLRHLEEEHLELQAANTTVARQAKQIQTVAELGRTLAEEIEPTRVAEVVHKLLRERVGFDAAAFYTRVVGSAELELASNDFVQSPLAAKDLLEPREADISRRATGQGLSVQFLTSPDEGLLGVVIGRAGPSTDASLFQALVPHLTIAAKHSRTFRTIQELNRDLEQKVTVRTEELSVANAELAIALSKAKDLDKLKSQFFDNISHELRTPLSLIVLTVEFILQQPGTPDDVRRYLETLQRAADRLMRLINRLLDLTKLEAGKTKLHFTPLHLRSFVEAMIPPFRALATSRGLDLTIEGPEVSEVEVDIEMMESVFQNLIGNALKFTSHGAISVRFAESAHHVTIEISDSGSGIRKADLPLIFDRFQQADSAGVRRFEGSGIGLALVKEGVELHGGNVAVQSEPGVGTTFVLTLPKGISHALEATAPRAGPPAPRVTDPRRALAAAGLVGLEHESYKPLPTSVPAPSAEKLQTLLLVEDDWETRQFIATILRQKYLVIEAVNGREGLARLMADKPIVVVSDVMMPEMSGLQLVQAVRADPSLAETPILLLTARHEVEDTLGGLSVGANDYIGKPFSPRELLARIDVQVRLRENSARLAASERLAALGMLSSGFAHEVRNPLNGLLNALQPLYDLATEGAPTDTALLKLAMDCGNRIQGLAESLLTLSRPGSVQLDDVRITEVLDQALDVLRWKVPKNVTLQKVYGFDDSIRAEPGALGQVFLNLMDNAFLAMPTGGTLALETRQIGTDIIVSVSDTGVGMAQKDLARLFEPFFTTRIAGQGTGLGLAFCRTIVDRHLGHIDVQSTPGQGTRFDVTLPIAGRRTAAEILPPALAIAS